MKRFFAILLLTLMLASLTVNAFADTATGTGTITISNATTDKTYNLYKIFDATIYDITADPVAIAYTYSGSKWNKNVEAYFSKDSAGYIRRIATTPANLTSEEVAALATLKDNVFATKKGGTTDTVVFDNLPYGYYYIESSLDTWPHENRVNPAVSIDSAKPNATIIDKNQGPTWFNPEGEQGYPANPTADSRMLGKWIVRDTNQTYSQKTKANSVNFGDTVSFEVAFNATNYYGTDQILTYFLNDTIADGFKIKENTLKVYFNGEEVPANAYTVHWGAGTDKKSFTVAAPWYTMNEDGTKSTKYAANTIFKVTYDAVLLPTANLAGNGAQYTVNDGNINTATFDYRKASDTAKDTGNPDAPPPSTNPYHLSTEENTVTYTYALGLTKIDGANKARLKGAEFTLAKVTGSDETRTETPITAKQAKTADGTVIPGVYEYSIAAGSVSQFATNDVGVLVIKGLSDGNTYTLREAKSPNGYNRNLDPVNVIFERDKRATYISEWTIKDVYTKYQANGTPINVKAMLFENEHGVALPITGGMGTTIFYILGGGLMFVAILLLITRKRMNNEK